MDEKKLQQQIVQLVQAAMQGNKKAQQRVQQIMQAAQQGDQQAAQIAQMIQAVAKQIQNQQVQAAKFGAKLNYIRQLNGKCPDGYEMQYFKQGGQICKKCIKKAMMEDGGTTPQNPVYAFKCGRKMKKKACGGSVEKDKCGSKMKKKTKISKNQQGGTIPIDWVRNAVTAIANIPNYLASGGNKIVGTIGRLVSPDIENSTYYQFKVSKPYPGQATSFKYIDKKPITGLRRYINHIYLPDGSSQSDTTYQSLSDHYDWSWNNKLFPEQRKKFENMKKRYGD